MSKFDAVDKLFRQIILQERPEICEHCRKNDGRMVYVAHILPKGGEWARLRYQRANILLLCYFCHMQWCHKNPLAFTEWLEEYKGKGVKYNLMAMARELPRTDLKLIAMCLKIQLKELSRAT